MVPEGLNTVSKRVVVTRWSRPIFRPHGANGLGEFALVVFGPS